MKSVGIITFHHAKHSYGAALQAYATVRIVEKLGYKAELINYENKYEQTELKFKGKSFHQKLYILINWAARFFIYGGINDPCRVAGKLDIFYRKVSKKKYRSIEALEDTDYDILLSGSDQIWNPEVTGGIDRCYLLDFGKPKKRVAYASSIGSYKFSKEELKIYKTVLASFDDISVREEYAAKALQDVYEKKIKVVCDPTLLLTGDQWRKEFAEEIDRLEKKEEYILTYFVGGNIEEYWERIERIVCQIKLPVYNVQSHSKMYKNVNRIVHNIMPGELVAYIDKAAVVLTDSFHGTAFSINLHKNFVAVINRKNPVRVQNLLQELGMTERTDDNLLKCLENIDYLKIEDKLEKIRLASKKWLIEALNIDE